MATSPQPPTPLDAAQQRLWFLQQLDESNPAYTICTTIEFTGPLNPLALRHVVDRIGRRHEMLRAAFVDGGEGPCQVVVASAPRLRLVDLRVAGSVRETSRLLAEAAARPFPLAAGPPVAWLLLRLSAHRHLLVLLVHHLVFDGGSAQVVRDELQALYEAAVTGEPAVLVAPGPGYRHVVARQRELTEQHTGSTAFWRAALAGAPPRSTPFSGARTGRTRPVRHVERLGRAEVSALNRLCRSTGGTRFTVLLAALGCWVGRHSGQRDVVLGSPVALRESELSATAVGPLINMLPLRLRLRGEPGFREVLRRTRDAVLDSLEHRWLPFERIVDELGAHRDLDTTPLFQVLFAYQHPPEPPRLPEVAARLVDVPTAAAKYDLTVTAADTGDGIELIFEADGARCAEPELVSRCRQFRALLAAAVADPERSVHRLALTTPRQLAALRAPAAIDPGAGELIHDLVAAAVAEHPDAVAVVHGGLHVTYRRLDAWSDGIAADLHARGCGPEEVVGVWLPRTPALLAALLGVLKAGAAFLPVDVEQPERRVRLMLAETGSRLLVGDEGLLSGRGAGEQSLPTVVPVAGPGRSARVDLSPRALAYVLYTSGSTGRPKGVAIEHRSAAAFLRWAGTEFGARGLRSVLATTSVGFDLAFFELFAPLAHGGTVVLAEDALHVPETPAAAGATLLNSVPSAVAALLDVEGVPASVEAVNLAGEPLPRELADRLHRRAGRTVVRNLYGPSEATTYATAATVAADSAPPTIGVPIGTARAWVADDRGAPAPDLVTGELLVGGPALARGYSRLPARTAEAFVPDPFGAPGSRVYRTGDLVRRRADGQLVFVGRRDAQIKLRGVRVEPGEVEQVLRAVAPIRDVVVLPVGDTPADRRLVAFASATPGERLRPEDALTALRSALPLVMIPSELVVLADLPHNGNGKLDRAALARRATTSVRERKPGVAPRNALERAIAREWQRVLGVERVGVHDGFFDLGGNSLGLLRLHHALVNSVHPGLRLVDLFQFADVADLAAHVDHLVRSAGSGRLSPTADPAQARGRRRRHKAGLAWERQT
ncbi:non-ribosomal peptide synthetase [Actinosynnema mirum]|uniref:Amino acid adenylation domain protein n=1 Tax=Actinosynnema mirum (strain ATCC 29888 / DSM 43827 / JCM 3225 / NBRC 14064 / NCIMB 13271 / NRRL B-12336 / IMRU 3971 / 101) TaxID=446462 RepID=C6WC00_ACTMD|nr:non-ribosomal peptide synthetase [Actinosynnema mirum]ACU37567.1 amino acid adenylation domain protein [Actinosynnema mirum DSM 43827]